MAEETADVRENVILVHWHDLGRHLACYGAEGVISPHLDDLAARGIRFSDAHSTAPLCSPARGSLFTGQYPHHNGLVGLAHHGFEYHPGVRTLPNLLGEAGYRTSLFGMQHESADPTSLGFGTVDVTESRCDYVVARAQAWLTDHVAGNSEQPFFLTAGFFETHRPYPSDEYAHADPADVGVPGFLPDTPEVREDLAGLHGSITAADAAVGRLLETVEALELADNTWIVFVTDHGLAFPRAKSTLYAEGTGVALIVAPPRTRAITPYVYDDLFSGVDLVPTLLDLLSVPLPADIDGYSHAAQIVTRTQPPVRDEVYTEKTYHDAFDPIRAVRTKRYSYIENYADRPELLLPLDIADSLSAMSLDPDAISGPRPHTELYDLQSDPYERTNVAADPHYADTAARLGALLAAWRAATSDDLPTDEQGSAIAERFMAVYKAKVDKRGPDEEALPSRHPEATGRDLADRVTSGAR